VAGNPLSDPEFPKKTADLIDRVVGAVRDRTTKPVVAVTRGIVFGSIVAVVAVALVALVIIAVVRGTQELFELALSERRAVWASYFFVGGLFVGVGALIMRARHSDPGSNRPAADDTD
jgi:H+/Cl- antiporter ClcA